MKTKSKNWDRFTVKQTLSKIETILRTNPNHCDYDYLEGLAQKLQEILDRRKDEQ